MEKTTAHPVFGNVIRKIRSNTTNIAPFKHVIEILSFQQDNIINRGVGLVGRLTNRIAEGTVDVFRHGNVEYVTIRAAIPTTIIYPAAIPLPPIPPPAGDRWEDWDGPVCVKHEWIFDSRPSNHIYGLFNGVCAPNELWTLSGGALGFSRIHNNPDGHTGSLWQQVSWDSYSSGEAAFRAKYFKWKFNSLHLDFGTPADDFDGAGIGMVIQDQVSGTTKGFPGFATTLPYALNYFGGAAQWNATHIGSDGPTTEIVFDLDAAWGHEVIVDWFYIYTRQEKLGYGVTYSLDYIDFIPGTSAILINMGWRNRRSDLDFESAWSAASSQIVWIVYDEPPMIHIEYLGPGSTYEITRSTLQFPIPALSPGKAFASGTILLRCQDWGDPITYNYSAYGIVAQLSNYSGSAYPNNKALYSSMTGGATAPAYVDGDNDKILITLTSEMLAYLTANAGSNVKIMIRDYNHDFQHIAPVAGTDYDVTIWGYNSSEPEKTPLLSLTVS